MNSAFPLARLVSVRRAGFRLRQRGFTLVELAIALAVVGLVLGASIIPLRALEETRQVQDEQRRMEVVRDAVVGYALRNQTRERTIKFVVVATPVDRKPARFQTSWEFHLPGGRPYLPCPDWDGDGFEDRVPEGPDGFVQGIEAKPGLTVTATIGTFLNLGSLNWFTQDDLRTSPLGAVTFTFPYGECRVSRGAIPWRTLGVFPADGWGSRHTYYADRVFANAMFGFDRQTIADIYDARLPSAPGLQPSSRRAALIADHGNSDKYEDEWNAQCPAIICDGGRSDSCVPDWFFSDFLNCESADPGLPRPVLKAGAVTWAGISRPRGEKQFSPGGVTDGLPFVIVSHGPNGRFAVNHWASLENPVDFSRRFLGVKGPVCNLGGVEFVDIPLFGDDFYIVPRESPQSIMHEVANGRRISPSEECERVFLRHIGERGEDVVAGVSPAFFVWEPPGIGDKSDFDDLLLWMTREELSLAVPGRIPPLPRMVVAVFP